MDAERRNDPRPVAVAKVCLYCDRKPTESVELDRGDIVGCRRLAGIVDRAERALADVFLNHGSGPGDLCSEAVARAVPGARLRLTGTGPAAFLPIGRSACIDLPVSSLWSRREAAPCSVGNLLALRSVLRREVRAPDAGPVADLIEDLCGAA